MVCDFSSGAMPSFCLRWWLDCDPAACWWLGELWPQLERLQGRFWWPALRILAGQRTHTWPEHPGRLQSPHSPGGLEQQAQTRCVPELQVAAMHQCTQLKNTYKTSCFLSHNSLVFRCACVDVCVYAVWKMKSISTVSMCRASAGQCRTLSAGTTTSRASAPLTVVTSALRSPTAVGGTISASMQTLMESTTG